MRAARCFLSYPGRKPAIIHQFRFQKNDLLSSLLLEEKKGISLQKEKNFTTRKSFLEKMSFTLPQ
jgi:hypothetical protein